MGAVCFARSCHHALSHPRPVGEEQRKAVRGGGEGDQTPTKGKASDRASPRDPNWREEEEKGSREQPQRQGLGGKGRVVKADQAHSTGRWWWYKVKKGCLVVD